eukprot:9485727-Pyramimonas_sp.AAC.1
MQTWNELGLDHPERFTLRSLADPKYVSILNAGHHFLNSISQLSITLAGAGKTPHVRRGQYRVPTQPADCAPAVAASLAGQTNGW